MADADSQDSTSQQVSTTELSGKINSVETQLASVAAQIQSMNQGFQAATAALTAKAATREEEVSDDDVYNPAKLTSKILNKATDIATQIINDNRAKDMKIHQLAQEYPEIHSNVDLRKQILAEQSKLPKSFQDTADGYEMAVLKAVTNAGILAKSKRPVVDEDFSAGSGRSSGGSRRERGTAKKVSEATVAFAELLRGRELTKDEQKSLENANQRDSFGKYR